MKIPFFTAKKRPELTFEELTELLSMNDLEKLHEEKRSGLNFQIMDSYDNTDLLHYYIKYQDRFDYNKGEIIKFLLDCNVNVNHKGNKRADQNAALHLSVFKKDLDSLKILLSLGAEVDVENVYGNTPLWIATMNYRGEFEVKEMIKCLLENGASLDKKNLHDVSAKDNILNIGGGIDAGFNNRLWDLRALL